MSEKRIVRYVEDPPEELFEATWRDAMALLESATPQSAFVLMIAQDNGSQYHTAFAVSSGKDRISASVLATLLKDWLERDPEAK